MFRPGNFLLSSFGEVVWILASNTSGMEILSIAFISGKSQSQAQPLSADSYQLQISYSELYPRGL